MWIGKGVSESYATIFQARYLCSKLRKSDQTRSRYDYVMMAEVNDTGKNGF